LPRGFDVTQPVIEIFGLCRRCSSKTKAKHSVLKGNLVPHLQKHES
jgi:hypothetical protein